MAAEGVLAWINSFPGLSQTAYTWTDLDSGLLLCEVAEQIIPGEVDFHRLKRETKDNWLLKSMNLNLLLTNLGSYYSNVTGRAMDFSHEVNITAIARSSDEKEIVKLVRLILGCAVLCDSKDKHIRDMMSLDQAAQTQLMFMIEEVMKKYVTGGSAGGAAASPLAGSPLASAGMASPAAAGLATPMRSAVPTPSRAYQTPARASAAAATGATTTGAPTPYQAAELEATLRRREADVRHLQEERDELEGTLQRMRLEMKVLQEDNMRMTVDELGAADIERGELDKALHQLKQEYRVLEGEKQRVLEEKDTLMKRLRIAEERVADLQIEYDAKNRALAEQVQKMEQFSRCIHENKQLLDEVDILKAQLEQAERRGNQLNKYKEKLAEAAELRRQMKTLEEENAQHFEKVIELEGAVSKIPVLKSQLDDYKKKYAKMEADTSSMTVSMQQKDFEVQKLRSELDKLRSENHHYLYQIEGLKRNIDELQNRSHVADRSVNDLLAPELKKKVAKLERENQRLKVSAAGRESEHVALLQSQVAELNRLKNKFKQDFHESQQRNMELEAMMQSMQAHSTNSPMLFEKRMRDMLSSGWDDLAKLELLCNEARELLRANCSTMEMEEKLHRINNVRERLMRAYGFPGHEQHAAGGGGATHGMDLLYNDDEQTMGGGGGGAGGGKGGKDARGARGGSNKRHSHTARAAMERSSRKSRRAGGMDAGGSKSHRASRRRGTSSNSSRRRERDLPPEPFAADGARVRVETLQSWVTPPMPSMEPRSNENLPPMPTDASGWHREHAPEQVQSMGQATGQANADDEEVFGFRLNKMEGNVEQWRSALYHFHETCNNYHHFLNRSVKVFHRLTRNKPYLKRMLLSHFNAWIHSQFEGKFFKFEKVSEKELTGQFHHKTLEK